MRVFISSLIGGFEEERAAVRTAVETLRHEPIMAEDFGASPNSPQIACLQGLRKADLVILVLGERYGAVQAASSLSATHEEYREAQGKKPVIAFVIDGMNPEPSQNAFIDEVQGWEHGLFRGAFSSPAELQKFATQALHDFELASAVAATNPAELKEAAKALLPDEERGHSSSSGAWLNVAIAGGPLQHILRPAEIENPKFISRVHQAALF